MRQSKYTNDVCVGGSGENFLYLFKKASVYF